MKGFVGNIEHLSEENTYFRKVLYTSQHSQLVVMSLKPSEDIGLEVHTDVTQFIRCEKGRGKAVLDGEEREFEAGWAVVIPAGVRHNIVNLSDTEDLKLYTLYAPPHHKDGTVHKTKSEAEADSEHFDGVTTD